LNCAAIATSLVEIERCGRALDMDVAASVGLEIGGVDFQFLSGGLHHHAARLAAAAITALPDPVGAARGERAHAMRARCRNRQCRHRRPRRNAERLRADLPRHRLHALAEIDRDSADRELAARIGMHQRLAGIAAEIMPKG
jgi:hypothetical protein